MRRVMLFDRFDQPIGELSEDEVFALERYEVVNGEHSLTITTTRVLEKGWRVVTQDARGKWREHVVYGTDALHDAGDRPFGDYYCVWSVQPDLMGTRISRMPGVQTPVSAAVALGYAVEGTARWQVGTVTNTATSGASMYDTNGWDGVSIVVGNWGGEVDATIEVGAGGVTARKVDLYSKQGDQSAKRRFDFGADMKSIRRKVEDGPLYCRITPRGMGEETDSGGHGRKVTIESVNGGRDYLENAAMVDLAKLPNGSGGWEYPTREVENADCQTPAQLLAWAQTVVEEYTVPKVTYDIDALQLAREGVDMHGVSLGDAVHVVDRKFGGLRISARVMAMRVNMLDEDDAKLTIGSIGSGFLDILGGLDARINAVTSTVQAMNGGTMSTAEYLSRLVARLNAEINASGGYTYITKSNGIKCYDTAVTDPLVGAEASAAVEIKGGTIRIANSKTAQGAWEWKTVFTSGHIASNVVTAAQLVAGFIGSAESGNYWNLDTGQLSIALTTAVGNTTMGTITTDVTGLKATYCTCATAASTQAKVADCAGFSLRTGSMVAVKFTDANTAANPTLNVNGTGAKPIYLNGAALPEDNWWAAGDYLTLVYNGSQWCVADGSTLGQLASTNETVASLSLQADGFDVSIKGLQSSYATCPTAAATQVKVVTLANFTKFVGQTVTVKFTYENTASSPELKVQNSDGSVVAQSGIVINNTFIGASYYWVAQDIITFVWDGAYWRVADSATLSRIKVLRDSIKLSVSNGALGSTASIKLEVNGVADQVTNIDLTKVREAFRDDTSAITISAGTITFNSNTFVVNSTYFSVTAAGVVTATSGTIGGMTIASSSLTSDTLKLDGNGLTFRDGTDNVARIFAGRWVKNSKLYGTLDFYTPAETRIYAKYAYQDDSAALPLMYYNREDDYLYIQCPVYFDNDNCYVKSDWSLGAPPWKGIVR